MFSFVRVKVVIITLLTTKTNSKKVIKFKLNVITLIINFAVFKNSLSRAKNVISFSVCFVDK